ncbi:MAG: hypothetical protein R3F61_12215 [Myxococcota bacterium]
MPLAELFTHTAGLTLTATVALLALVGAVVGVFGSGSRHRWALAATGLGIATLAMLGHVGHGVSRAWSAMFGDTAMGGLSAGLYEACGAGVLFGGPLALACVVVAFSRADPRDERSRGAGLVLALVGIAVEGGMLVRLGAPVLPTGVGGVVMIVIAGRAYSAPALGWLLPFASVAWWHVASGAAGLAVLESLSRGDAPGRLATDPWFTRALVYGIALAAAGLLARWRALVAVPAVGFALLVGSPVNVEVAATVTVSATEPAEPPSRW